MYNNNNPSVNLSYPVTTAAMYSQGDSFNTLKYNQVDAYANMQDPMEPTDLSYSNTFGCSGASATTATYSTPTTASNFEPPYVDMQPIIDGNTMASQQSGFVPPLVEPQGYGSYDNKAWMSQPVDNHRNITMVRPGLAMSQIRGSFIGRRHRDEVNPEEEHRKRVRRERNKLAAARCRQRRTDLTNKLQDETDELHDEQHQLEDEIEKLRQQKEQLEFVLKAHKSSCKAPDAIRCQPLPQPRPATLLKKEPQNNDIVVKTEPKSGDEYDTMSPGSSCSSNMSVTSSHTLPSTGSMVHSTIARPHTLDIPARSLPSNSKTETVTTTTTAESKSNMAVTPGVFTLGFEAMMDGSTGLTPITGSTGLTPIMSAPSCASQVQRSSSDSSSSENNLASPTLMAL